MDIEAKNHQDPGHIKLTVLSVLSPNSADEIIAGVVRSIDQRIIASGDGVQIFEEGLVAKITDIKQPESGDGNINSCLYAMHFLDSKTAGCARMHFHPGERQLIVTIPDGAVFNVNSLSPIDVFDPIHGEVVKTQTTQDPILDKLRYDTQISGPSQIVVQIPSNVSHQFSSAAGRAGANSFHPNEAHEKEIVGAGIEAGTMQGHTTPFVSFCAMEIPHGAHASLSKESAVAAVLDFKRNAQADNLFGPYEIAQKLLAEHQVKATPFQINGAMAKLLDGQQIISRPSITDMAGKTKATAYLATSEAISSIAEDIRTTSRSM